MLQPAKRLLFAVLAEPAILMPILPTNFPINMTLIQYVIERYAMIAAAFLHIVGIPLFEYLPESPHRITSLKKHIMYLTQFDQIRNNIRHNRSHTYYSDNKDHWYECINCGKTLDQEPHQVYCNNPTVCAICGIETSSQNIYHPNSEVLNGNLTKTSIG